MSTQKECLEQLAKATQEGCRILEEKAQNLSAELYNAYHNKSITYMPMPNKGWECPKCGRIYSPNTTTCTVCNEVIKQLLFKKATSKKGI